MGPNINIYQQEENLAVIVKVNGENLDVDKASGHGIKKIVTKRKKKKTKPLRIVWIAAACVLFLAITSKVVYTLSTPWEERVYNRYYEQYEGNPYNLDDGSDFNQAIKNYKEGKTEDAWYIIKNLDDDYSRKKLHYLYKALILMDGENYSMAIEMFDLLLKMPDNKPYVSIVRLYKGLCHLKINDIAGARQELSKIQRKNIKEYKKANKIIKAINRHLDN